MVVTSKDRDFHGDLLVFTGDVTDWTGTLRDKRTDPEEKQAMFVKKVNGVLGVAINSLAKSVPMKPPRVSSFPFNFEE